MKKVLSVVFILLVLLLIVASLFDLQTAKLVFVKDNLFSYIFEHLAPAVFGTILMTGASFIFVTIILIQKTILLQRFI